MKEMPPWSYSSLSAFETCPRQYWLTRVAKKIVERETEAQRWGTAVHKALELRVKDGTPLPEGMKQWEGIAARFAKYGDRVTTEQRVALTRNLEPTEFFAKDCWYRGVVDVTINGRVAVVWDYKTGKVKNDHDQLELFAATHMSTHPETEKCRTGYIWLVHDKVTPKDFVRDDVPEIWKKFIPRVQRLAHAYNTDRWTPKPSGLCNGWCPAEGHCEFWKPKRRAA